MRSLRKQSNVPNKLPAVFKLFSKHLLTSRLVLLLNGLVVALFLALTIYVKFWSSGEVIEILFGAPFNRDYPYYGMLTTTSNLLLCMSTAISLFSVALLRRLHPKRKLDWFLLWAALILGIIMVDRVFRLTIILYVFQDVRKIMMFVLYGSTALLYGSVFRRRLLSTPYLLVVGAFALLIFGGFVDLAKLPGQGTPAMLEDGSTFLATLNMTLYVWLVCRRELMRSLSPSKKG